MSGCGHGHGLVKDMWKKLWFKFPGLTSGSIKKTSSEYNLVVKGFYKLRVS